MVTTIILIFKPILFSVLSHQISHFLNIYANFYIMQNEVNYNNYGEHINLPGKYHFIRSEGICLYLKVQNAPCFEIPNIAPLKTPIYFFNKMDELLKTRSLFQVNTIINQLFTS